MTPEVRPKRASNSGLFFCTHGFYILYPTIQHLVIIKKWKSQILPIRLTRVDWQGKALQGEGGRGGGGLWWCIIFLSPFLYFQVLHFARFQLTLKRCKLGVRWNDNLKVWHSTHHCQEEKKAKFWIPKNYSVSKFFTCWENWKFFQN